MSITAIPLIYAIITGAGSSLTEDHSRVGCIGNSKRIEQMHAKYSIGRLPARGRHLMFTGLSALLLAGLAAAPAQAEILAASTNAAPQTFGAVEALVDLATAAGAQTSLSFTTSKAQLVEISFSAECSVVGTGTQYGSINLRVNAAGPGPIVPVAPTVGTDDAFCSGGSGRLTASMTTTFQVPAGTHQLQVLAVAVNGASQFRLDDLAVTIDN